LINAQHNTILYRAEPPGQGLDLQNILRSTYDKICLRIIIRQCKDIAAIIMYNKSYSIVARKLTTNLRSILR